MTPLPSASIAALFLFCAAVAHAQRSIPTAADVRARLHSTNAAEVAWAAFDAGALHLTEVASDLVDVLDSPAGTPGPQRDYLVAAVLDGLIQLQGTRRFPASSRTPSPATLDRYHRRWPVQTLLLMTARGPERGEILESWFRSAESGLEWIGIANLLVETGAHGFASDLLQGVTLTLQ